jgi:hypothetical protein
MGVLDGLANPPPFATGDPSDLRHRPTPASVRGSSQPSNRRSISSSREVATPIRRGEILARVELRQRRRRARRLAAGIAAAVVVLVAATAVIRTPSSTNVVAAVDADGRMFHATSTDARCLSPIHRTTRDGVRSVIESPPGFVVRDMAVTADADHPVFLATGALASTDCARAGVVSNGRPLDRRALAIKRDVDGTTTPAVIRPQRAPGSTATLPECPGAAQPVMHPPVSGESGDGLPLSGSATREVALRTASAHPGSRVRAVAGRAWTRNADGSVSIVPENVFVVEIVVATAEDCPTIPAVEGVPLVYRFRTR